MEASCLLQLSSAHAATAWNRSIFEGGCTCCSCFNAKTISCKYIQTSSVAAARAVGSCGRLHASKFLLFSTSKVMVCMILPNYVADAIVIDWLIMEWKLDGMVICLFRLLSILVWYFIVPLDFNKRYRVIVLSTLLLYKKRVALNK